MKKRIISYILAVALVLSLIPMGAVTANAASNFKASDDMIRVLKEFEGFSRHPYCDYSQWTVGYGTRVPDGKLAEYKANGIPMDEAEALLKQFLDSMGAAAQTTYFMNLPAGVYPHFPKGQHDNTHLQPAGAVAFGALIARELHKLGGEYAAILNYDFPKYLYESDNFGVDTGSEYEVEPQDQPAPKA